ncbi:hypothetical protein ACN38_g13204 [Penicillium nordicum]|uniref:Uncharacterized protein n=1 Tax=Penicillium nordicum TaxID=229535 RepID=A0A0N0RX88_9EURO|nr:hypothetical protein ACN38_g13204 [Penicillium nordicum]
MVVNVIVGASGSAADTPKWVYDFLRVYQPDNPFKDEPVMTRHVIARHAAKKKKAVAAGPAPIILGDDGAGAGPARAGKNKDKGKGKAADKGKAAVAKVAPAPVKTRKAVRDAAKAGKKRAAPAPVAAAAQPARKKAKGKKSKKDKRDDPEPPARADAIPRAGPVFDTTLYATPLDWPKVYHGKDDECFLDVFERLREVRRRVQHDYEFMRDFAISQGWWEEADDTEESESESSEADSEESVDVFQR